MPHFGSTRPGLWLIKRVVAPLERRLYRLTGGRVPSTGLRRGRVLLLTTTGRRTGRLHTTPVFYLEDGERLFICNVTTEFEHASPWVLNLRAHSIARVQVGRSVSTYNAREANRDEVDRYWPRLVTLWPAYQALYAAGGQRAVFVLEPTGPLAQ